MSSFLLQLVDLLEQRVLHDLLLEDLLQLQGRDLEQLQGLLQALVMMSAGRCVRWSECFHFIVEDSRSQSETLAEVDLACPRVPGQFFGRALQQDTPSYMMYARW